MEIITEIFTMLSNDYIFLNMIAGFMGILSIVSGISVQPKFFNQCLRIKPPTNNGNVTSRNQNIFIM